MNLKDIEARILQLLSELRIRESLEKAVTIGELLVEGKKQIPHGQYEKWVKATFGISPTTAREYVLVFKGSILGNGTRRRAADSIRSVLALLRHGRRAERFEKAKELANRAVDPNQVSAIITGDSLEWLEKQKDNSIPFFITDAPYGLGVVYRNWQEADNPTDHWRWFRPYWEAMCRVVIPGGNVVCFQAYKHLRYFEDWFPGSKIVANCIIIRNNCTWEPVIVWTKPGATALAGIHAFNDWFIGTQAKTKSCPYYSNHPCVKPLDDMIKIVKRYSTEGSLVVDPFAGTAPVCAACELTNRKYLGIERDPFYADLARKRLEETKARST